MSEQNTKKESDLITSLTAVISVVGGFLVGLIYKGAIHRETWKWSKIKYWLIYLLFATTVVYGNNHDLPFYLNKFSWIFTKSLAPWVYYHLSRTTQLEILLFGPFLFWLSLLGAHWMIKVHSFQKAIDLLGMKTTTGLTPKVRDVINESTGQKTIVVSAVGFDLAEIRNKKVILESCLNQFVQDIRLSDKNRGVIEIRISDKELPLNIPYNEVSDQLTEPYSFIVGEGMRGLISANLEKVHHLLVAGSTGGGKSYFVKQLLVSLLQSSKHIQLYLLDLKRGVEMKVFEPLENVYIAKDSLSAVETLDAVVKEMNRRFDYLEKHGCTEIDSKRDKLDRIVVLVDEASELFTIIRSSKAVAASAISARDLADKIAKLGRVAGIHLILATQKVIKETIDTRVQSNINARMIFRVNTTAASMTVLGNKLAADLPEIGGRGIWSVGSRDQVVQTPKLTNEEVGTQVSLLLPKFNSDASPLYQKMLISNSKMQKEDNDSDPAGEINDGINANTGAF